MYCKKCGKQIDADSVFCSYCGSNIKSVSKDKEENVSNFQCNHCGFNVGEDAKKCPNCGVLFHEEIIDNGLPRCPRCGRNINGNFCAYCGNSISNDKNSKNKILYMCLGVIGFIIVLIGCFIPFVTAEVFFVLKSFNYLAGDGKLVLLLTLIGIIFLLCDRSAVCLAFNVLAITNTIVDGINVSTAGFNEPLLYARLDIGFYVIIIGLLLTIVMSFILASKKEIITAFIVDVVIIVIYAISIATISSILNNAKEASNLRSVEAYAKAIEYGIVQYEYKNNGDLPKTYCDVEPYISYTNTDVVCDVTITDEAANVKVEHCKVGNYEKHSYKYDGTIKTENRGAEKEDVTRFATRTHCY